MHRFPYVVQRYKLLSILGEEILSTHKQLKTTTRLGSMHFEHENKIEKFCNLADDVDWHKHSSSINRYRATL
jgi:hypothetical protein